MRKCCFYSHHFSPWLLRCSVSSTLLIPSVPHTEREFKIWYWSGSGLKWKWSCTPYDAQWPCAPCIGLGSDQAASSCCPDHCRVRAFGDRFLPWPAIRLYIARSPEAYRDGESWGFLPCHHMWNGHCGQQRGSMGSICPQESISLSSSASLFPAV